MASYLDNSLQQFSNGAMFRPVGFIDFNNTIGNTYDISNNNSSNNSGMIGSILGGAGSLIGSIGNLFGQRAANKTNIAINKMNNEFNERMLEKQMAYNLDMWQRTNEYNSPAAMRQRLVAAGFNPYMAISGGGSVAGNASGFPGSGLASSSGNAHVDPVQFDTNGFNAAMQNLSNDKLRNSEANLNDIEARTSYQRGLAEISEINARVGNYKAASAWTNRQNFLFDMDWQNQYARSVLENYQLTQEINLTAAQVALTQSKNSELQQVLEILPVQLQADLFETISRINLNDAHSQDALAHTLVNQYTAAGLKIEYEKAKAVMGDWIDTMKTQLKNQFWRNILNPGWLQGLRDNIRGGKELDLMDANILLGESTANKMDQGVILDWLDQGYSMLRDGISFLRDLRMETAYGEETVTEYDKHGNAGRRTVKTTRKGRGRR